jgi:hypothetical protein
MEWVKIFVSWPFVVFLIAIAIFLRYGKEIRQLLNRIATAENFEGPGGFKFSGRQQPNEEGEAGKSVPADATPLPAPQDDTGSGDFKLTQEEWSAIEGAFRSERATAAHWAYRYLNYFLAFKTQQLRDWLGALGRSASVREVDATISGETVEQRAAMTGALEAHHLILLSDEMYSVTDKGREYIGYRGPLPTYPQA